VLSGIVSLAAGLLSLAWPGITAMALFLVIAIWAIALGITELIAAVTYADEIEGDWAVVLSGILWIAFGVILFVWPATGILAVLAMIASFSIIRGVMLLVAAARMKRAQRLVTSTSEMASRGGI
jgi:uncharacterized membrane protein HdeD (DUF308 family)